MRHISAHILDSFRKLRLFQKLDKGININPEAETSYTTQFKQGFLKYVDNEYCAKHWHQPVNKPENVPSSDFVTCIIPSGAGQIAVDP